MTIVTDHGHNMTEHRTIPAGEFKAKCLKLMDEVRDTGEELIITVGSYRRAFILPDSLKRREVRRAQLEEGSLRVTFGESQ